MSNDDEKKGFLGAPVESESLSININDDDLVETEKPGDSVIFSFSPSGKEIVKPDPTLEIEPSDIQEALPYPPGPEITTPYIAGKIGKQKKGVSFVSLLLVVFLTSIISSLGGSVVALVSLSSPEVQERVFGARLVFENENGENPTKTQNGQPSILQDQNVSGTKAAKTQSTSPGKNQNGKIPTKNLAKNETQNSDSTLTSDSQSEEQTSGTSSEQENQTGDNQEDPQKNSGDLSERLTESYLLPIKFAHGQPRIISTDKNLLRDLAKTIIANRIQYEVIGFAGEDETDDPHLDQRLKLRRATRSIDLIRSFGPSSHRFKARAAREGESQNAISSAPESNEGHGSVIIRPIE